MSSEFWEYMVAVHKNNLHEVLGFDPDDEPWCERCQTGVVCTVNVAANQAKQYGAKCPQCNGWAKWPSGKLWLSEKQVNAAEDFSQHGLGADWIWGGNGNPEDWKHGGPDHEHSRSHKGSALQCSVKGCSNTSWTTGVEDHHFAPRVIFKESADSWPVVPICTVHHDEWHEKMNGYKYEPYVPEEELGGESG